MIRREPGKGDEAGAGGGPGEVPLHHASMAVVSQPASCSLAAFWSEHRPQSTGLLRCEPQSACSRRRDCHFTDIPSPSILKHLLKLEGVQQNDSLADGHRSTARHFRHPTTDLPLSLLRDTLTKDAVFAVIREAAIAVGETVILLTPPSPSSRRFNMDGEGVSAK